MTLMVYFLGVDNSYNTYSNKQAETLGSNITISKSLLEYFAVIVQKVFSCGIVGAQCNQCFATGL